MGERIVGDFDDAVGYFNRYEGFAISEHPISDFGDGIAVDFAGDDQIRGLAVILGNHGVAGARHPVGEIPGRTHRAQRRQVERKNGENNRED